MTAMLKAVSWVAMIAAVALGAAMIVNGVMIHLDQPAYLRALVQAAGVAMLFLGGRLSLREIRAEEQHRRREDQRRENGL